MGARTVPKNGAKLPIVRAAGAVHALLAGFILVCLSTAYTPAAIAAGAPLEMFVNEPAATGISAPIPKPGGGDYVVVMADDPRITTSIIDGVIHLASSEPGTFPVTLTVRRIGKSSCGGASAKDIATHTLTLRITFR